VEDRQPVAGRRAHAGGEGEEETDSPLSGESDVGLNPRTLGS